jgi:hypothetical protein
MIHQNSYQCRQNINSLHTTYKSNIWLRLESSSKHQVKNIKSMHMAAIALRKRASFLAIDAIQINLS